MVWVRYVVDNTHNNNQHNDNQHYKLRQNFANFIHVRDGEISSPLHSGKNPDIPATIASLWAPTPPTTPTESGSSLTPQI